MNMLGILVESYEILNIWLFLIYEKRKLQMVQSNIRFLAVSLS